MQKYVQQLPQPRYVPEASVKGMPDELKMLVQGQFKGCNYAVMCAGEFPCAVVEIPVAPKSLPSVSIDGFKDSIGRFCDKTYVAEVCEVPKSDDSVMIKFAFNKYGDYSVKDASSEDPEVRAMNEKRQKWTTEEILAEIFTFIGGLEL